MTKFGHCHVSPHRLTKWYFRQVCHSHIGVTNYSKLYSTGTYGPKKAGIAHPHFKRFDWSEPLNCTAEGFAGLAIAQTLSRTVYPTGGYAALELLQTAPSTAEYIKFLRGPKWCVQSAGTYPTVVSKSWTWYQPPTGPYSPVSHSFSIHQIATVGCKTLGVKECTTQRKPPCRLLTPTDFPIDNITVLPLISLSGSSARYINPFIRAPNHQTHNNCLSIRIPPPALSDTISLRNDIHFFPRFCCGCHFHPESYCVVGARSHVSISLFLTTPSTPRAHWLLVFKLARATSRHWMGILGEEAVTRVLNVAADDIR